MITTLNVSGFVLHSMNSEAQKSHETRTCIISKALFETQTVLIAFVMDLSLCWKTETRASPELLRHHYCQRQHWGHKDLVTNDTLDSLPEQ